MFEDISGRRSRAVAVALVLVAGGVATVTPARAQFHGGYGGGWHGGYGGGWHGGYGGWRGGWGPGAVVGGALLGLGIGAVIANSVPPPYYYPPPAYYPPPGYYAAPGYYPPPGYAPPPGYIPGPPPPGYVPPR